MAVALTEQELRQVAETKAGAQELRRKLPETLLKGKKPRAIKSKAFRHRENVTGTIEQTYDQLAGEWHDWLEIARKYEGKVPPADKYDIRHDILLELNRARQRDGEPLPFLRACRIASLTVALYWRKAKRYPITASLDATITDTEGQEVRLLDTVAYDKAIDVHEWLDLRTWLQGCPIRLIQIAEKKLSGEALTAKERMYLMRFRRKEQTNLFQDVTK